MQIIHSLKGKEVLHKVSAFNNKSLEKTPSLSSPKAKNYIQHTGSVSWKRHCLILLYILALTFINPIMAQDSNDVLIKKNQFVIGVGASF